MARPPGQGIIQTWPLPISTQALAISDACSAYGVPLQVFMGMYNNESTLGTNPNVGPDGPFQMISGTRSTYHYPATATPNSTEFRAQANGAAHYLHDIYVDFVPSVKSWRNALAGYNAGAGGYKLTVAQTYAARALAFQIPAVWKANLSGNFTGGVGPGGSAATPGGTAGAGGTGTLLNDSSGFRVGDASNPDEDYWTAINRLCQDRYWYVFSDGETIYVADGPDLMKQDTAMTLDRVADAGSITHLEFTFDNCLDVETPIRTPDGWTRMGDLQTGDFVYGSSGEPTRVVRAHDVHYGRDCYRVRLDDGTSIVADGGHLWETIASRKDPETTRMVGHQRYLGIRTTEQIASRLYVPRSRDRTPAHNHQIRATPALLAPDATLPIDPYVFGMWLGDGNSRATSLAVGHLDIDHVVSEVEGAGYGTRVTTQEPRGISKQVSHRVDFSLTSPYQRAYRDQDCLSRRLRTLDVFANKHVPDVYLRASYSQRLALLQGIMDTDGTMGRDCQLGFVSHQLALGATELIRSLGYRTSGARYKPPRGASRPQWSIGFAAREELNCFRLPRKAERYAERIRSRRCAVSNRRIVAVDPVPSVPVRCITVEADDHLFLAGEGLTLTCNTAWSYSATRHKRHRAQRRTALARVTSPVEGLADVVCKIDEVRAGDVIEFDNCGPGDGKWLIGDVRRSVFEVTSEITIVPALTPLSEGQLNPAHQNTNNLSAFSTNITLGGYTNPVGNWTPSRIDAGVDGTLSGPYVAPGASEILIADSHNAGWKGGGYIAGRFTDGKLKGKVWYVAEGVAPLVAPHSKVGAGQPIARTVANPYNGIVGNIETGWAVPTIPALPLGHGGDQGPNALAAGTSFNRFLIKLGAKPGSIQGAGVGVRPGNLPPGYP